MDNRIIMLVMALTTFIAYPFLSGNDRKQVAPLATPIDEIEDEEEIDDDAVMMEDEDEHLSDLQLKSENEHITGTASDSQIKKVNEVNNSTASDPQLLREEDEEENVH